MLQARVYLQALKLAAGISQDCTVSVEEYKNIQDNCNSIKIQFTNIPVDVSHVTIPYKDLEQSKTAFRIANTHYKKSLTKFVLDGYVTEHIAI